MQAGGTGREELGDLPPDGGGQRRIGADVGAGGVRSVRGPGRAPDTAQLVRARERGHEEHAREDDDGRDAAWTRDTARDALEERGRERAGARRHVEEERVLGVERVTVVEQEHRDAAEEERRRQLEGRAVDLRPVARRVVRFRLTLGPPRVDGDPREAGERAGGDRPGVERAHPLELQPCPRPRRSGPVEERAEERPDALAQVARRESHALEERLRREAVDREGEHRAQAASEGDRERGASLPAQEEVQDHHGEERHRRVRHAAAEREGDGEPEQIAPAAPGRVAGVESRGEDHERNRGRLVVDERGVQDRHREPREEGESQEGLPRRPHLAQRPEERDEPADMQHQERKAQRDLEVLGRRSVTPGLAPSLGREELHPRPRDPCRRGRMVGVGVPARTVLGRGPCREVDVDDRVGVERVEPQPLVVDRADREERRLESLEVTIEGAGEVARARDQRREQEQQHPAPFEGRDRGRAAVLHGHTAPARRVCVNDGGPDA